MGSVKWKYAVRVSALCVGLTFCAALAQEGDATGPIPSVEQAAEQEAEPVAEGGAQMPLEGVEATEEVPTPVAEVAPVNEAPEKVRTAPKAEKPVRSTNSGVVEPNIGVRAGLGISSFAGHRAIPALGATRLNPDNYDESVGVNEDGKTVVRLGAGVSFSLALSVAWDLTDLVDLGVPYEIVTELQYSLYTAYGSRSLVKTDRYAEDGYYLWPELVDVAVQLHAIELPILARFRYDRYYLELGPQFGVNVFNRLRAGLDAYRPFSKEFAFGPAVGFGVDLDGVIAGIRWQMNVLEYASKTNGRPWALHATATYYPF